MILRMIQSLKKMEAKIDKMKEMLNKEIEDQENRQR